MNQINKMKLPILLNGILGLIHIEAALHLTSPWLFKSNRNPLKSTSYTDSMGSTKEPKKPVSIVVKSYSIGSLRAFTPSEPIPIPLVKKPVENENLDSPKKPFDFDVNYKAASSDSSGSSVPSSHSTSPEMFAMSYESEYAKFLQLRKLEREERKLRTKMKKKAERLARKLKARRESSTSRLYYTEGEKFDVEDYAKKRLQNCRFEPTNPVESNSDFENDSDFGGQAKGDCYSLSF